MGSQTNEVKFKNSESLLQFCFSDKATHKKAELYKKCYLYIYSFEFTEFLMKVSPTINEKQFTDISNPL